MCIYRELTNDTDYFTLKKYEIVAFYYIRSFQYFYKFNLYHFFIIFTKFMLFVFSERFRLRFVP